MFSIWTAHSKIVWLCKAGSFVAPSADRCEVVKSERTIIRACKKVLLLSLIRMALWWCKELHTVDHFVVMREFECNPARSKLPHDDLCVFASTRDESVALTDINLCDVTSMRMK